MITQIFKEVASSSITQVGKIGNILSTDDEKLSAILKDINDKGWHVLKGYIPKEKCTELVNETDRLMIEKKSESNYWTDYNGSDTRLYRIQELTSNFDFFLRDPFLKKIERTYLGALKHTGYDNLLVNKIQFVENNLGSGGGWHRDSPHSNQFKAIAYIADAERENGPFQFINGSQKFWESMKIYLSGLTSTSQYRFTPEEINDILDKIGHDKLSTLTGEAGDVILVDTKGIHRGMPIEKGCRYAMTIYYNDKNF